MFCRWGIPRCQLSLRPIQLAAASGPHPIMTQFTNTYMCYLLWWPQTWTLMVVISHQIHQFADRGNDIRTISMLYWYSGEYFSIDSLSFCVLYSPSFACYFSPLSIFYSEITFYIKYFLLRCLDPFWLMSFSDYHSHELVPLLENWQYWTIEEHEFNSALSQNSTEISVSFIGH